MDKIINVLLLIIIFVFDPLAISLVIAANFAFDKAYPKKKYKENLYKEKVEIKDNSSIWPEDYTEEDEKRMDVIGQNGNDGEHYSELDLNKDGIIDNEETKLAIKQIKDKVGGNLKSHPEKLKEVQRLEGLISSLEDDLTIKY